MKKALFTIGLLISIIPVSAQTKKRIVYGNSAYAVRDFFPINKKYKVVSQVQDGNSSLHYYLLDEHNLIIDTLASDWAYSVIPNENQTFTMLGHKSSRVYRITNESAVEEYYLASQKRLDHPISFNDRVIQTKRKGKRFELLSIDPETGEHQVLINEKSKIKLDEAAMFQLPVVYGFRSNELWIFSRKLQTLFWLDENFMVSKFKPNASTNGVWSFFLDAQTGRKYFLLSGTNKSHKIYQFVNSELAFIRTLDNYPKLIFNDKIFICKGSVKTECTYYYYDL